ncbi:MAG: MraY family glycosyltransferase [Betaproteobacteria bacterium]|nr:MraY family glycosyltransferase [Betaproteobacteria bacterium]
MIYFASFISAMFVTMALIPPLMRSAEWLRFVDVPDERKVHTRPIPRIGGLAMAAGAVLPVALWLAASREVSAYLWGTAIILMFGVWDDRKNLDYRLKFLGQLIAILIVVLYGGVAIHSVPFMESSRLPPYASIPLTVFSLVGITNAINLADGLDGLAGGTTLLSLMAVAALAYIVDAYALMVVALAVMGSILGFLRFNTYPARIFMGDGGSQFLGFSTGVLAIMLTQRPDTPLSPAIPAMLLGLPILDTLMVMVLRICDGKSPFSPDKRHIHHQLLALGFDHYEAVFLIYVVQALLVVAALFLRDDPDSLIVGTYVGFCVGVIVFFQWAATARWRARPLGGPRPVSFLERNVLWLGQRRRISNYAFFFAAFTLPGYFILAVAQAAPISTGMGELAAALAAVSLVLYPRQRRKPFGAIERAVLYVTCVLVVHLPQTAGGSMPVALYENIYIALLAAAILVGFRFSSGDRFQVTPLDFLVIFLALAVPNLPALHAGHIHLGAAVAKVIVLFYGVELILNHIWRRWDCLRLVSYVTLLGVVARWLLSS